MDFKYTYGKIITKICKFERKFDRFTPYWRKGRGFNSSNEKIPLGNWNFKVTRSFILRSSSVTVNKFKARRPIELKFSGFVFLSTVCVVRLILFHPVHFVEVMH